MERFVLHANQFGEMPLLFDGWAVYHYSQYAGSRDVDFIVTGEHFETLVDFLVASGYSHREVRLFKDDIFFDLYKQSEDIGSESNKLQFKLLYRDAERVYLKRYGSIGGKSEVLIPKISNLLFFKIHALVNRNVPKDRSDVIALLLKTNDEELNELTGMLSPELKTRLETLRNDKSTLALVTSPTQRNINLLNKKIKQMTY